MPKNKKLELDYYYYNYGNKEADDFIADVLAYGDYKTFMKLYHSPDNGIDYFLPDVAFVREEGSYSGDTRNITMKRYFDRITYYESEHG